MSRTIAGICSFYARKEDLMPDNKKQPIKGLNLRIQETKEDIAKAINKSQLPPGVLLMLLNEFTIQMQSQNARMIELERKYIEEGDKDGEEIHKS